MLRLSIKQLMAERTRFWLGTAGISAAVALILSMQAIFAGVHEQLARFVRHSGGDLIVAQEGVRNLYLAHSSLPEGTLERVRRLQGVEEVVPVLMMPASLKLGGATANTWLVGIPDTAKFGGPWSIKDGMKWPAGENVVLDAHLAKEHKVSVGDEVEIAGKPFRVGGLSNETSRLGSVMTFVSLSEVHRAFGMKPSQVSYLFVRLGPGASAQEVAAAVRDAAPGTHAMTRQEVIENDIKLSADMGGDSIQAMTTIALFIGLLSVGVTVFANVSERIRDYAVLKTVGAGRGVLFQMVVLQAVSLATFGYIAGSGLILLIAPVISTAPMPLPLLMVVKPSQMLANLPLCLFVGVASALVPWLKVARVEPMSVFQ